MAGLTTGSRRDTTQANREFRFLLKVNGAMRSFAGPRPGDVE